MDTCLSQRRTFAQNVYDERSGRGACGCERADAVGLVARSAHGLWHLLGVPRGCADPPDGARHCGIPHAPSRPGRLWPVHARDRAGGLWRIAHRVDLLARDDQLRRSHERLGADRRHGGARTSSRGCCSVSPSSRPPYPVGIIFREPRLAGYLALAAVEIPLLSFCQAHINVLVGLGGFRTRALAPVGRWVGRLLLTRIGRGQPKARGSATSSSERRN